MLALPAAFISETRQNILMGAHRREGCSSQHSQAENRERKDKSLIIPSKDILADIIFFGLSPKDFTTSQGIPGW